MVAGRWLLAITFDAEFSIEHVYGHHRRLATPADPASARRGEHFYAYLLRSVLGQTRSAFELERNRLRTLGHGTWSLHNRYLRGWLMSAAIVAAFVLAAGAAGVVDLRAVGAGRPLGARGRQLLRALRPGARPGQPVEPRHSWNSNKRLSNVVLFNLARHSHHHAEGDAQFWQLRSYRDAPTLPYGYLTCMLLVFLAPGWYRNRMTPLAARLGPALCHHRRAPPGRRGQPVPVACVRCSSPRRGTERCCAKLFKRREPRARDGRRRTVRLASSRSRRGRPSCRLRWRRDCRGRRAAASAAARPAAAACSRATCAR